MIDSMKYRLNYDDNSERLTVSFDKDNKKDVIIRENGRKEADSGYDLTYIGQTALHDAEAYRIILSGLRRDQGGAGTACGTSAAVFFVPSLRSLRSCPDGNPNFFPTGGEGEQGKDQQEK